MRLSGFLIMIGAATWLSACGAKEEAPRFVAEDCPAALVAAGREVACGSIQVPENPKARESRKVSVPIVIVRARAKRDDTAPVFFLHGGPGGWVLADLPDMLASPLGQELIGQEQDWIFFDQRGAGRSTPLLDCGSIALNDAGPMSAAAVKALGECGRQLRAQKKVDFGQYTSTGVAHDIQDIRRSLGFISFDLYGVSYGTRIAASALAQQNDGLRAVILDSPWPPEAKWTELVPVWVSREVRQVLGECARDKGCRTRYGNVEVALDNLLRAWAKQPLIKNGATYRPETLSLYLMDALYEGEMVSALPRVLFRIVAGDVSPLAPYAAGEGSYFEGQHLAVVCNEEIPFERAQAVRDNARGDPIAEAIAGTLTNYFEACREFTGPAAAPIEQEPVHTKVPTLFLAAGIDAGCPAELSEAAVRNYAQGQLVIFPYSTHQVARSSACGRRMAREFLRAPQAKVRRDCLRQEPRGIVFR